MKTTFATSAQIAPTSFLDQLGSMKIAIDEDIKLFWGPYLKQVDQEFGPESVRAVEALAELMSRGGKRFRGALTAYAYRLLGGKDETVALGAARAVEMLHAYVLVLDDIIDHSNVRRGGPTAHRLLEAWHREAGFAGDSVHFGHSMGMLAGVLGAHEAMLEIGRLPVSAQRRLAALDNLNHYLITTCHGQFQDVLNEALSTSDERRVEAVLIWKTAYYSFANPLQLGAILAGAGQAQLDQLMKYSLAAGRAFQISDDVIGIFGEEKDTGKSPLDDMKEGKRTFVTVRALRLAPPEEAKFLEEMLGNPNLTMAELKTCRRIIQDSGALDYAQTEIVRSAAEAKAALRGGVLPESSAAIGFLDGLADYWAKRKG